VSKKPENVPALVCQPIGFIRSGKHLKHAARHQPDEAAEERNHIELLPVPGYQEALHDLVGFDRVWLVWWFHLNTRWRSKILPPFGPGKRLGLFSTRSPHRPNPIGITPVRLYGVKKFTLEIGPCDLVDGTPILDIKPYLPSYDSFPQSATGWWGDYAKEEAERGPCTVKIGPLATEQLVWLEDKWEVEFKGRMIEILTRDPRPHRTRRIRNRRGGGFDIACGAWRAVFDCVDTVVTVTAIEPAFPPVFLRDTQRTRVPDREAQIAFLLKWPKA
jgi:tRNA-Thr(GGU) m(6)t(6)A37 methyltransferase TsaA